MIVLGLCLLALILIVLSVALDSCRYRLTELEKEDEHRSLEQGRILAAEMRLAARVARLEQGTNRQRPENWN